MYGETSAWSVPGYTEMRGLGTGGAGRVVLARHDSNDTLVAIKYLADHLRTDLNFVARFRHEARLLAMMEPNPHVARFYEYVEGPHGAAIIMELVDGVSLRAMLRAQGPTGPEAALVVLKGSLLALATAHGIGIVHRDYKPENVLVEIDGNSKLVDFGIAVRVGDGLSVAGTPPYMAPEQWAGGPAGPATDVYAAAVVFFECLTGTRPFQAPTLPALARLHQTSPPPVEQVPPALQSMLERGMAKHAQNRPPSAEAFLRELEAVATSAYGVGWEERGQRRLAALAGLLLPFFPLAEEAPEVGTTLAQSSVGGGLLGRASMKIGMTTVLMAAIAGGTVALVNSFGSTTLQAGASVQPPSVSAVDLGAAGQDTDPVDDTTPQPSESPSATKTRRHPRPKPTPTATVRRVVPNIPARRPVPSAKPTPAPSPKAKLKPKPKPSPSPSTDDTLNSSDDSQPGSNPRPSRPSNPNPNPEPSNPPSSDPPTDPGPPSSSSGSGPATAPVSSETPTLDPATVPVAIFAVGLMTTGLVPATLAMRRMTGRHRRRR